jgi:hypothetical protein
MKFVLVGEIHGTAECPKAFLEILKKHKVEQVALEFKKNNQKEINQFLSGSRDISNLSIFKNKDKIHDGRASESIKDLIIKLRKNKMKIYFVDSEPSNPLKRDYLMARNLMEIEGKTAFLCGNVHASKTAIKFPFTFVILNKIMNFFGKGVKISKNGIIETCGSFLPSKETISYKVIAVNEGEFYNFGAKKIKPNKKFQNLQRLPKIKQSSEDGFDFFYLVEKFTASR